MANKLLSAIEDNVLMSAGSVPVVIEGIEHIYDTKDSLPSESSHNSHELLYLRDGKIEVSVDGGGKISLGKGSTIVIRPLVKHRLIIKSNRADILNLYFGFIHDTKELSQAREGRGEAPVKQKKEAKNNSAGPSVAIPGSMAQISLESFLKFADLGLTEDNEMTSQPCFVVTGNEKAEISMLAERIVLLAHLRHARILRTFHERAARHVLNVGAGALQQQPATLQELVCALLVAATKLLRLFLLGLDYRGKFLGLGGHD